MRIGTRGSALALAQARHVAQLLPGAELRVIQTSGDRGVGVDGAGGADGAEGAEGAEGAGAADKSRWVDAIEGALLAGEIDLAVHSAKDLPGELSGGLALLGTTARAAAEDVLCGAASLDELPDGARVGTSSLRRSAQLLAARPDIEIVALRGNVDTRLRRLRSGAAGDCAALDAIVLARAGLQRLDLDAPGGSGALDPTRFVPAPGQGALALEARAGDERMAAAVVAINDSSAFACLLAERALAAELDATCRTPLGAHAATSGGSLRLLAWVGLPDGSAWIADELDGEQGEEPERLGRRLAERMRSVGARELLEQAEALAA